MPKLADKEWFHMLEADELLELNRLNKLIKEESEDLEKLRAKRYKIQNRASQRLYIKKKKKGIVS